MRFILISLLLIMPMKVIAEKYDEDATLRNIGPIYVHIQDNAKGGCWTNIKEVRDYVIGQVEARGGKTVPSSEDEGINVSVSVTSFRLSQSKACVGNISVQFVTPTTASHNQDLFGFLFLSTHGSLSYNPDNFNIRVLEIVQEAFEEW